MTTQTAETMEEKARGRREEAMVSLITENHDDTDPAQHRWGLFFRVQGVTYSLLRSTPARNEVLSTLTTTNRKFCTAWHCMAMAPSWAPALPSTLGGWS